MKKLFAVMLCGMLATASGQTIRVAAAANVRYLLREIDSAYCVHHPGTRIVVSLESSGTLCEQILHGAEFDLFLSADRTFAEKIVQEHAAIGEAKTYAIGQLALWSTVRDVSGGMNILLDTTVRRIAVAKPEVAPYGARAVEALRRAGLYDRVKNKLVFADNIAQAAQYVATGNAEAGFVALSLLRGPEVDPHGSFVVVDPGLYAPIDQACVLVKTRQPGPAAAELMNFLLSDDCAPIYRKYGYLRPSRP